VNVIAPFLLVLLLTLAFFQSLTRVLFGTIASHFDPTRDVDPVLSKIKQAWELPGFHEALSFGRAATLSLSFLLLFTQVRPLFELVHPASLALALEILLLFPLVYGATVILPGILGTLRPYGLARLCYAAWRTSFALFAAPGRTSRLLHDALLKVGGHDPSQAFLTDEEKRRLEKDSGATGDQTAADDPQPLRVRRHPSR